VSRHWHQCGRFWREQLPCPYEGKHKELGLRRQRRRKEETEDEKDEPKTRGSGLEPVGVPARPAPFARGAEAAATPGTAKDVNQEIVRAVLNVRVADIPAPRVPPIKTSPRQVVEGIKSISQETGPSNRPTSRATVPATSNKPLAGQEASSERAAAAERQFAKALSSLRANSNVKREIEDELGGTEYPGHAAAATGMIGHFQHIARLQNARASQRVISKTAVPKTKPQPGTVKAFRQMIGAGGYKAGGASRGGGYHVEADTFRPSANILRKLRFWPNGFSWMDGCGL